MRSTAAMPFPTAAAGVSEFAADLPVSAGQNIGVFVDNAAGTPEVDFTTLQGSSGYSENRGGDHPPGATQGYGVLVAGEVLLNADIETTESATPPEIGTPRASAGRLKQRFVIRVPGARGQALQLTFRYRRCRGTFEIPSSSGVIVVTISRRDRCFTPARPGQRYRVFVQVCTAAGCDRETHGGRFRRR